MNENEILKKAIKKYGTEAQIDMAIEEMAELIKELLHKRRGRVNNVMEELVDVSIMVDQLKIIFNDQKKFSEIRELKLLRLAENL